MIVRKKLITFMLMILGLISTGSMYHNMIQPIYGFTPSFTLSKGAKIIYGEYGGREQVWDVGKVDANQYVLMSTTGLGSFPVYNTSLASTCVFHRQSNGKPIYLNCPKTLLYNEIANINLNTNESVKAINPPFLPSIQQIETGGSFGLSVADCEFMDSTDYWVDGTVNIHSSVSTDLNYGDKEWNTLFLGKVSANDDIRVTYPRFYGNGNTLLNTPNRFLHMASTRGGASLIPVTYTLRPFMVIGSDVAFAAPVNYVDGNLHGYVETVGIPGDKVTSNAMQLRLKDNSMNASLLDIKNQNNNSISKAVKDTNIQIQISANRIQNSHISILLYSATTHEILYYRVLSPTIDGTNNYTLDLTGIPIGKYDLAILNEDIDRTSGRAVISSNISDTMSLEIVEPHKLTYTKTPQSGASAGNDYEFSKNVNAGQAVGIITVNPQGVMPLTYTLETNGDNSYQNFEIDGLSSGASSSTSLNVKIKSGAPDLANGGLKAGTYKFCITALDANGYPVDSNGNPTEKVCTSITVEKINSTVTFDNPNQTKKSVAEAATSWNETATATPSTGPKLTYSVSGGDVSLISIHPDTGAITYTGSNTFGKVKIKATVDDDPSTGNDNYNSASVEKEIVIYREVDGSVTPDSNSSDTTTPTFTASDSNIKTGGIIGTIHGTLGTPDTIGGSTTTYHYGLKPGVGNASFFSVDPNTGVIKTTANLGVNSYHITVTVSDNWSTKEIPVTINVGMAAAENLKFYENSTSNTVITSKSVKATDTGVTVYATVKVTLRHFLKQQSIILRKTTE